MLSGRSSFRLFTTRRIRDSSYFSQKFRALSCDASRRCNGLARDRHFERPAADFSVGIAASASSPAKSRRLASRYGDSFDIRLIFMTTIRARRPRVTIRAYCVARVSDRWRDRRSLESSRTSKRTTTRHHRSRNNGPPRGRVSSIYLRPIVRYSHSPFQGRKVTDSSRGGGARDLLRRMLIASSNCETIAFNVCPVCPITASRTSFTKPVALAKRLKWLNQLICESGFSSESPGSTRSAYGSLPEMNVDRLDFPRRTAGLSDLRDRPIVRYFSLFDESSSR